MTVALPQIILAAVVPLNESSATKINDNTGGQIQRWDLMTGISLGTAQREFYCASTSTNPMALLSPNLSLQTTAFVALNVKSAALNYYMLGKERPVHRFFGQDRLCVITSFGSYLLAGNEDGKLFLWDIPSGELLSCVEEAHLQRITVLRVGVDGIVVSGSQDGTAKVWSVQALLEGRKEPLFAFSEHTDTVTDVHIGFGVGRNCRMATSCMDRKVRVYDMVDFHLMAIFEFPSSVFRVLLNMTETLLYAACENGDICVVDLASDDRIIEEQAGISYSVNRSQYCLAGHKAPVTSMALSLDDGQLVSGDQEGHIVVWNTNGRQILRRITAEGSVRWLGLVTKASLDALSEERSRLLTVAQPKRTISNEKTCLSKIRPVIESTRVSPQQPSEDFLTLKAGYNKLLNHLFTKLDEQM
jgi:pre-rRNA-processing protein IPI3